MAGLVYIKIVSFFEKKEMVKHGFYANKCPQQFEIFIMSLQLTTTTIRIQKPTNTAKLSQMPDVREIHV
jgi:hypothetical protein